ncbi:(2Fe-2S)-binding protein [Limnohabitans sp.]|uniref:(2Fe-2S)-binding protein n=1 Tax=Limnohabitans sp. TaxID=1907725 RepID=UPI0038B800F1
MNTASFQLNGQAVAVQAEANTALVHVLRNPCNAKDVRYGCGAGNCGACTVIVDGHAQQSCNTPNGAVQGCDVRTPASLPQDPVGAVVLQAFVDEQAAQCGYCINGMLMSVTALLQHNRQPSDGDITQALNRHLCRCGTHVRIVRATRLAIQRLNAKG